MKPNKGLGQHFLKDPRVLKKICMVSEIIPSDTIVEVGPGTGVLTLELAKRAKKVIAIEKDGNMVEILRDTLKGVENVEIIYGDALEILNHKLQTPNYKVVANIPYYITSPLIRKFLEAPKQPSVMILMVQKEVARRICAKVPDMNLLAVSVQFYATPKIISYVSKGSFWPVPKVDSAIIKIVPHGQKPINADAFFKIVKAGFSQPRKKLINNLTRGLTLNKEQVQTWLIDNQISPDQRAETLTIADWQRLTRAHDKV